jgi:hypothetical protein
VLVSAPRRNKLCKDRARSNDQFYKGKEVRDRGGAIASTRGRVRSPSQREFGLSLEPAIRILQAMNFTKNIGMLLLAIYLILAGLGLLVAGIAIPPIVMGILALAAGIFILIGR